MKKLQQEWKWMGHADSPYVNSSAKDLSKLKPDLKRKPGKPRAK